MNNSTFLYATILALATATISGTNNFLTKIAVTAIKDPIVYTTLKNALVAVALAGILILFKKWGEISKLNAREYVLLALIGIVGGSIPFALYFTGLAQTTALNAGLIHKTLFLWVMLLAVPILKERVTFLYLVGAGMIFAANFFVGGFNGFKFNAGELMILSATLLWAVENIIAKIALKSISSLTVAASRMIFGSVILGLFMFWQGNGGVILTLNSEQWGWVLLTSALLTGYVLTWYSALKYASATYVATLLVPATLITNLLSSIFITHALKMNEAFSALFYTLGTALVIVAMIKAVKKTRFQRAEYIMPSA